MGKQVQWRLPQNFSNQTWNYPHLHDPRKSQFPQKSKFQTRSSTSASHFSLLPASFPPNTLTRPKQHLLQFRPKNFLPFSLASSRFFSLLGLESQYAISLKEKRGEEKGLDLGLGLPGGVARHKIKMFRSRKAPPPSFLRSVKRTLKVAFSRFSLNLFSYLCGPYPNIIIYL